MSQRRRSKSLEEVEQELESLGLTRQTAAAIVRLANTLKQNRKLRADHIEKLIPGKRIHPCSPLARQVWNQSEIEGLAQFDREAQVSSHETSSSDATIVGPPKPPVGLEPSQASLFLDFSWLIPLISSGKDVNALGDIFLSSMDPATLTDVASRVGDISISKEYPSPLEPSATVSLLVEEREDVDSHKKDCSKWW
ncbi:hypothetical protein V8C37DRAFT_401643 [Trichoderma ceciliae]